MNPHDEPQLEAAINRELKALANLRAPAALASRVMTAIEQGKAVPWHRRAWHTWPLPLRGATMLAMLAAFSGLCFLSWQFIRTPEFTAALGKAGNLVGSVGALWNAAGLLKSTLVLVVRHLNPALILGCGVALALGYATCLGVGTVYVRLGFARR